jgi:hypothetical protein
MHTADYVIIALFAGIFSAMFVTCIWMIAAEERRTYPRERVERAVPPVTREAAAARAHRVSVRPAKLRVAAHPANR